MWQCAAPAAALDNGEELLEEVDGERRVAPGHPRPVQARVVLDVHLVACRRLVILLLLGLLVTPAPD